MCGIHLPRSTWRVLRETEEGRAKTNAVNEKRSAKESEGRVTRPDSPLIQYPRVRPDGTLDNALAEARQQATQGDSKADAASYTLEVAKTKVDEVGGEG